MNPFKPNRLYFGKHRSSSFLLLLVLVFSFSSANAATLVSSNNGFEAGSFSGYSLHMEGGSAAIVNSPVASGKYAAKFSLIRSSLSKTASRAEANYSSGQGDFAFNTEYWVGIKFRYDDWAKDSSPEMSPLQIHRRPSKWGGGCGGEVSAWSVAPFFIATQNDTMKVMTYRGQTSWSGPVAKGKWINMVFHFDIGWDSNGYVEVWKDGAKLFKRSGKLHEQIDDCGKPWRTPFIKFGIYKWDWGAGKKATQSSRRTIVIDDVKIAKGSGGMAMVSSITDLASAISDLPSVSADLSNSRNDAVLAHWPMTTGTGATTPDISGNGHTATLANGAQLGSDGAHFDGVDDYLNAGVFPLAGKAMTLSAWVWADNFKQCSKEACTVAAKAAGTGAQDQDIQLSTIKKRGKTRLRFRLNVNGATSTLTAKAGNLEENSWVHVAAVFNGKTMRLYQNGVLVGSKAVSGSITPRNKFPISIGGNAYDAAINPWSGKISDVRLFNYALSKDEVAELAQ